MKTYSFIYRNSLSLTFLLLMVLSLVGQIYTGWKEHNNFLLEYKASTQSIGEYLLSGHFLQATFENWESEFLSIFSIIFLSIYLRQFGSSQSKAINAAHTETGGE